MLLRDGARWGRIVWDNACPKEKSAVYHPSAGELESKMLADDDGPARRGAKKRDDSPPLRPLPLAPPQPAIAAAAAAAPGRVSKYAVQNSNHRQRNHDRSVGQGS
jgi:hypothetical protein